MILVFAMQFLFSHLPRLTGDVTIHPTIEEIASLQTRLMGWLAVNETSWKRMALEELTKLE